MDTLRQRIGIARRRLNLERFGGHLFRSWCVWLSVALVAIVVRKFVPMSIDDRTWIIAWLGGALAGGFLTAVFWTLATRRGELEAAIEIDKRFGLKERVSSALALDAESRETPAGQALLSDTIRRIERLDVGQKFRVELDRSAWWPLVPGGLALLIALVITSRAPDNPAIATPTGPTAEQLKKTAKSLQKKLERRREEARKKGLTEADALLKKLEEGTKDLGDKAATDKERTLVKLNDLSKELESRREKLAGDEKFKQQLNQLKDLKRGPADRAAQAMKNGDFKQAMKAIEELGKKLADGKLDKEEKKQLAEQMKQMADALKQAAEAHKQAQQEVKQALEKARQRGDTQRAEQLQKQLDKMQKQQAAMQRIDQLAQQCKQCADAMKQGNAQQAQQALDQLKQQMSELAQSQEEMQMLDRALDEIAQAKKSMTGEGDKEMNAGDEGEDPNQLAMGKGGKSNRGKPGMGLGEGRGKGERPEVKGKTGFYDSKVNQKVGKGAAVVTDLVDGPNKKGEVTEEIKSAFENARHNDDDPLTGQRLPRDYRDHAKEYFDAFRKGQAE
jgi:chemotaxis protein histidine kinase CheA